MGGSLVSSQLSRMLDSDGSLSIYLSLSRIYRMARVGYIYIYTIYISLMEEHLYLWWSLSLSISESISELSFYSLSPSFFLGYYAGQSP